MSTVGKMRADQIDCVSVSIEHVNDNTRSFWWSITIKVPIHSMTPLIPRMINPCSFHCPGDLFNGATTMSKLRRAFE